MTSLRKNSGYSYYLKRKVTHNGGTVRVMFYNEFNTTYSLRVSCGPRVRSSRRGRRPPPRRTPDPPPGRSGGVRPGGPTPCNIYNTGENDSDTVSVVVSEWVSTPSECQRTNKDINVLSFTLQTK